MLKNNRQIWSEDACRIIAADLAMQAARWTKRAEEIRNFRGNIRPVEDAAPAMKAAARVLAAVQNGMDPMQECNRVCARNYLKFDQVWQLYRHKLAAYEREERAKRNRAIKSQAIKTPNVRALASKFGLSHGQISKILNKP